MNLHLSCSRPGGRSPGFTLLELMIVLVLVGILAAVILPEMRGSYEHARLRAAARRLTGAFTLASSRAILANTIHRVRWDRRSGQFAVETRRRRPDGVTAFEPLPDLPGSQGAIDDGIRVEWRVADDQAEDEADARDASPTATKPEREHPPGLVQFHPDGTAEPGRIVLRDRAGFGLALEIQAATARVHVVELSRERP